MTYKELLMQLSQLTPEQLRDHVVIYDHLQDEYYGSGAGLSLVPAGSDQDVLDEGHIVLRLER